MSDQHNPWAQASGGKQKGKKHAGKKGGYKPSGKHGARKKFEKPYQPGKNNIIVPEVEKPFPKS